MTEVNLCDKIKAGEALLFVSSFSESAKIIRRRNIETIRNCPYDPEVVHFVAECCSGYHEPFTTVCLFTTVCWNHSTFRPRNHAQVFSAVMLVTGRPLRAYFRLRFVYVLVRKRRIGTHRSHNRTHKTIYPAQISKTNRFFILVLLFPFSPAKMKCVILALLLVACVNAQLPGVDLNNQLQQQCSVMQTQCGKSKTT